MQCPNCGHSMTDQEFFQAPNGECPSCHTSLHVPTPEIDTADGALVGELIGEEEIF